MPKWVSFRGRAEIHTKFMDVPIHEQISIVHAGYNTDSERTRITKAEIKGYKNKIANVTIHHEN
jgi:hypothetical protein